MVVMVRTVGGRYPLAADLSWHSQQNSRNFHKFLPSPSLLRRPRVAKWWWRASFCALCWGRPPVPIKTKARKLVASGTSPEIGSGFRFAATKKKIRKVKNTTWTPKSSGTASYYTCLADRAWLGAAAKNGVAKNPPKHFDRHSFARAMCIRRSMKAGVWFMLGRCETRCMLSFRHRILLPSVYGGGVLHLGQSASERNGPTYFKTNLEHKVPGTETERKYPQWGWQWALRWNWAKVFLNFLRVS